MRAGRIHFMDVVIAADDNASKYLIKPFYKDAGLPFVFCGVNWDASNYGFPYRNVTGMIEVAGAKELVKILQGYAKGSRVALLADDTLSSEGCGQLQVQTEHRCYSGAGQDACGMETKLQGNPRPI
ncbi:MAG: hypothetical protein GY846_16480 [Deltaproteobacteria bacterium]|nr:hypothetical protein [Deltaproteobacteria bacterium]